MSKAKPSNKTHSVLMNNETFNVLMFNGKIKGGKYKGYQVEIYNETPTGKYYIMSNDSFEKIEGENEATN